MEITLVLISTTLSCVYVGLQLFHVKRHPDVLPSISLVMLSILTLGHMIPLMLNFEALFLRNPSKNMLIETGGWIETNEVIVREVGMADFLLQFRLLQKTWAARKSKWISEKKVLFVALPLYAVGALVAVIACWRKWHNKSDVVMLSTSSTSYKPASIWGDLKSYAGLVLDGFLLPQILLNMFQSSRVSILSHSFYIGNTFVRLLPRVYDFYRAHNHFPHYDGSYIYANPSVDLCSTAWDVVIPLGGLLFVLIIYSQQQFGSHVIFPHLEVYGKVPVVSDA